MRKLCMAALLWGIATGAALADQVSYKADLEPSSVVPPTTSRGSGEVTVRLDTSTRMLRWSGTYHGLSGPATTAHFHGPAAVGENAKEQLDVKLTNASHENRSAGRFAGEAMLTDAQIDDLEDGKWYVDVHTDAHPQGEIRGQLRLAH
jgi:hypothetical protein